MENFKYLLIIGGHGCLGDAIIETFKNTNINWRFCVIDMKSNENADSNIILEKIEFLSQDKITNISEELEKFSKKYDAILDITRAWVKGSVKNPNIFDQSYEMFAKNYYFSLLAAHLATKYLANNGLLMFTGAAKVFRDKCPEMLAYQIAKTCTHSLAHCLSDCSDLPEGSCVITILPEIIDTPEMRIDFPLENYDNWISPDGLAKLIKCWAEDIDRPKTGGFAILRNDPKGVLPDFV